jgi:hypothetical protein
VRAVSRASFLASTKTFWTISGEKEWSKTRSWYPVKGRVWHIRGFRRVPHEESALPTWCLPTESPYRWPYSPSPLWAPKSLEGDESFKTTKIRRASTSDRRPSCFVLWVERCPLVSRHLSFFIDARLHSFSLFASFCRKNKNEVAVVCLESLIDSNWVNENGVTAWTCATFAINNFTFAGTP